MKGNIILAIAFLTILTSAVRLAESQAQHKYWYSYSDKKDCAGQCLRAQRNYPGKDFVVIYFKGKYFFPNFASCYVYVNGQYRLWNYVARNTIFNDKCGKDTEDWYRKGYTVIRIAGRGIGASLNQ